MARPNLTALFSKFLFRETLTDEEKGYIRSDINAETAGAAATAQALAILTAAGDATAKADVKVDNTDYNAGTWDGVTTVAPSKNAVRDKFVSVDAAIAGKQAADDDLTAYANAADAAARRALIGALGASDVAPLALTSVPRNRTQMVVSGTLSPDFIRTLISAGVTDGVPYWTSNGLTLAENSGVPYVALWRGGSYWNLYNYDDTGGTLYLATALSLGSASPEGLSYITISGTGTPTVAAGSSVSIPTPTVIGQSAIVSHSDSSKTEWGAVSLTQWLPRTAGIIWSVSDSAWRRQTLAADGTAEYELLPNQ